MKRQLLKLMVAASLVAASGQALAEEGGGYIGLNGGMFSMSDGRVAETGGSGDARYKAGYTAGIALGRRNGNYRFEVALDYKSSRLDTATFGSARVPVKGAVSVFDVLFNGYYDLTNGTPFAPYAGLGVGAGRVLVDRATTTTGTTAWDSGNSGVFAFQLAGGLNWKAGDKLAIDAGYRYFLTTDAATGTVSQVTGHSILTGIRYNY